MNGPKYLSRGIDYLGDLGAKLRDLQGYRTLAHELIQNADDAPEATSMAFDVADDALVVDNDGTFSDCGESEEPECPWKQDGIHDHRCDFHRFRHIASGDKRGEPGTTGAFGIGFVAVYQITDCPELISAGRHWTVHEERIESERIEVCPGCPTCTQPGLPATRFVLPWARNADSGLRRALSAEPVPQDGPKRMVDELVRSLPIAIIFLKRIRTIEIKHTGQTVRTFQREDDNDSIIITDGEPEKDRIWHLFRGGFGPAADKLRKQQPGRIEAKRSSQVVVAIPDGSLRTGLLCACLPTEQDAGLPFHINADFFPTNDRKRVILDEDYQSAWNRLALRAAAHSIGEAVGRLPALLGAQRFWGLVSTLKEVADRVEREHGESTLVEFWKAVEPQLHSAKVIYTTSDQWTTCADACLLLQKEETGAISMLEGLGVKVVHEELRPYQNLLRAEAVGVPPLNIDRLADALMSHGLSHRVETGLLPSCLASGANRDALWAEIALLLSRQERNPKAKADDVRRLREVAIAPGRDNALWPCGELYSADDATVQLFMKVPLGIPFVAGEAAFAPLTGLCRLFDAAAAIECLRSIDNNQLQVAWEQNCLPLSQLFGWFENRRQQIVADEECRKKLAALSIFPSSEKLRVLNNLALPGDFRDPLGLAVLVDLAALGGRREFLRDLGMPELDFRTYAVGLLPAALDDTSVTSDKRRAAIVLLAGRAGELRDDQEARRVLAATRLVECTDGEFLHAGECHFDNAAVRDCLDDNAHIAALPQDHEAAVRDLYAWLGIANAPRLADIVKMIQRLTAQPYSPRVVLQVQKILAQLGTRVDAGDDPFELQPLKVARWLPARGKTDRWYAPTELFAAYQDYLFESQALFLDSPKPVQTASQPFLKFLNIQLTPPAGLVVKHLIYCSTHQNPVNAEVYRFLNDNVADPSLVQLRDSTCLWLGDAYRKPNQVFWGVHPFGQYRWRLGEDLRAYSNLLKRLGVRDAPDYQDALNVLQEISAQFGATNTPLDGGVHGVLMACWQVLENSLDESAASDESIKALRPAKCVPNAGGVLCPPDWMFFENRAGLAAKFGEFLARNVVPRPLGAGRAYAVAGVRPLGAAVKVELLECADPIQDPKMTEIILTRRNEIGRVLDSQSSGRDAASALARLQDIRCATVTSLTLRYSLSAFNRELKSERETAPALYQVEDKTLLFSRREGQVPWAAIARELAVALFPDEDPGRFAAGLKEVLASASLNEASAILDELGFARLDTDIPEAPSTVDRACKLGVELPPSGTVPSSPPSETQTSTDLPNLTPEEALKRVLGPNAPPPTPPASVPDIAPEDNRDGPSSRTLPRSEMKKGRPVLRSYLPAPDGAHSMDGGGDDDENEPSRSPVDEAGVRRVLEYEKTCDLFPREMPHKNPGYDIESRDACGNVVRYIEVKSFSGQWRDTFAVLSRPQFNKARDLGALFWLYVVERAQEENLKIYRIQNPALKANHFMFDDGWSATAESELFSGIGR